MISAEYCKPYICKSVSKHSFVFSNIRLNYKSAPATVPQTSSIFKPAWWGNIFFLRMAMIHIHFSKTSFNRLYYIVHKDLFTMNHVALRTSSMFISRRLSCLEEQKFYYLNFVCCANLPCQTCFFIVWKLIPKRI